MKVIFKDIHYTNWNYLNEHDTYINDFISNTLSEHSGYELDKVQIVPPTSHSTNYTNYDHKGNPEGDNTYSVDINGKIILFLKQTPLHEVLNNH